MYFGEPVQIPARVKYRADQIQAQPAHGFHFFVNLRKMIFHERQHFPLGFNFSILFGVKADDFLDLRQRETDGLQFLYFTDCENGVTGMQTAAFRADGGRSDQLQLFVIPQGFVVTKRLAADADHGFVHSPAIKNT